MTTEVKLIVGALALAILVGLGFWAMEAIYEHGMTEGKALIQTQWDADRAVIAKQATQAKLDAQKAEDAAQAANQAIETRYAQELTQAHADNADLAVRLRNAQSLAAHRSAVPQDSGSSAVAATRPASSVGRLDVLTANALNECNDNRLQLDALSTSIRAQL